MKRIISVCILVGVLLTLTPTASALGLGNFQTRYTYKNGQFEDVSASAWYAESVKTVYELGLMMGNSAYTFNPNGYVTEAEALTIAARLHKIYATGNDDFSDVKQQMENDKQDVLAWVNYNTESPGYKEVYNTWYAVYAYYLSNRTFDDAYPLFPFYGADPDDAPSIDEFQPISRSVFVYFLANALPDSEFLPINDIKEDSIPDASYRDYPEVYMMYRAGILTGNDEYGTFEPDKAITRSEVAAVVSRMVEPKIRKTVELKNKQDYFEGEKVDTTEGTKPLSDPIGDFYYRRNSVNGITLCWEARNNTNKTIKYCKFRVYFTDRVYELTCDEITGLPYRDFKLTGPIEPGRNVFVYTIVGYVPACDAVTVGEVTLEYMDGTSESFLYDQVAGIRVMLPY